MIKVLFNTDPDKRISVGGIRSHPWYMKHKPEILSFYVVPPALQAKMNRTVVMRGNKPMNIIQRPNLIFHSIVKKL